MKLSFQPIRIALVAILLTISTDLSRGASWTPDGGGDHGGQDWTPDPGVAIAGEHTNIANFIVLSGTTNTLAAYNRGAFGFLTIRARRIEISGVLDGSGKGLGGGGGGGGGGGADQASPGSGVSGGSGAQGGQSGRPGSNGAEPTGGEGGTGGSGFGLAAGSPGRGGPGASDAGTINDGRAGSSGGYLQPGVNGDSSTDDSVVMGSGGGGGGGGGGGHSKLANSGAGGGGGGAAGGNGGGMIRLYAEETLVISGEVRTAGTRSGAGNDGGRGQAYTGPTHEGAAGDGGRGGSATVNSTGLGGDGGSGATDTDGEESRRSSGAGGAGGRGGSGGGGGILLSAQSVTITGTVNATGGGFTTSNGGTVKIFHGVGGLSYQDTHVQRGRLLVKQTAEVCVPAPSGLIGWWRGENDATDAAGLNNGILRNGPTFAAGRSGSAFSFDGIDDYVDIGDLSHLDNAQEITVMAWIRKEDEANPYSGFVGKYDNTPHDSHKNTFLLYNGEGDTQNRGEFYVVFEDNSESIVNGTTLLPVGDWVHLTATWRSSDGRTALYKNGIEEAVVFGGAGKRLQSHRDYTGKIGEWGVLRDSRYKFKGQIDEVAIFNRALSSNEIAAIYAAGSAGMCKPACIPPPSGLVAWLPGDGTAIDLIGGESAGLRNGATFDAGISGQTFALDGIDDQVAIPDSPALRMDSLTIGGWFNFREVKPNQLLIGKTFGNNITNSFALHLYNGSLRGWTWRNAATGASVLEHPWAPAPGRWYYLSYAFDDSTFQHALYIDGSLVASGQADGVRPILYDSHPIVIGADIDFESIAIPFSGLADDVAIWNRALAGGEVATIYSAGSAGMCKPVCVPPPSGLVALWPGDGNPNDIVGGNTGTLQDGATFQPGKVGAAFSIVGSNSSVALPDVTHGRAEGTISFWFNATTWNWDPAPLGIYLLSAREISSSGNLGLDGIDLGSYKAVAPTGELMFGVWNTSSSQWEYALSGVVPNPGVWYHVAGSWGAAGVRIFVNGSLKGANPYSGSAPDFIQNILLGRSAWQASGVECLIDDVAIYGRALAASEVATIYSAGSAGMCKPTVQCVPAPSGLVGWWPGDGNADELVSAVGGSPYNGTSFSSGVAGQAFQFDGSSGFVEVIDSARFYPGTNSFTWSAWFRTTVTTTNEQVIAALYEPGGGNNNQNVASTIIVEVFEGRIVGYLRDADLGGPFIRPDW